MKMKSFVGFVLLAAIFAYTGLVTIGSLEPLFVMIIFFISSAIIITLSLIFAKDQLGTENFVFMLLLSLSIFGAVSFLLGSYKVNLLGSEDAQTEKAKLESELLSLESKNNYYEELIVYLNTSLETILNSNDNLISEIQVQSQINNNLQNELDGSVSSTSNIITERASSVTSFYYENNDEYGDDDD